MTFGVLYIKTLIYLLSAASSLGWLPTYIALKPDPGSQKGAALK